MRSQKEKITMEKRKITITPKEQTDILPKYPDAINFVCTTQLLIFNFSATFTSEHVLCHNIMKAMTSFVVSRAASSFRFDKRDF
jgi:hypothetical protein